MLYGGACYAGHGLLSNVGKQLAQRARHFHFGSAPHDVVSCISSCRPAGQCPPIASVGFLLVLVCVAAREDRSRHTRDPRGFVDSVGSKESFFLFFSFCFSSTHLPGGQEIVMSWRLS